MRLDKNRRINKIRSGYEKYSATYTSYKEIIPKPVRTRSVGRIFYTEKEATDWLYSITEEIFDTLYAARTIHKPELYPELTLPVA